MRNPARIPQILQKLEQVWTLAPDFRLGQLVEVALNHSGSQADVFNVEDDILEAGIDSLLARLQNPSTP